MFNPSLMIALGVAFGCVVGLQVSSLATKPFLDDLPEWMQAIGSIAAILATATLWRADKAREHRNSRTRDKEHLQRIVAGLAAEIRAAVSAAERRLETVTNTMAQITAAAAAGHTTTGTLPDDAMRITEAVMYKAMATDLGRFPTQIVDWIVQFYELSKEFERTAVISPLHKGGAVVVNHIVPRIRMYGGMALAMLENFQKADFEPDRYQPPSVAQLKKLAREVGYPLSEVLAEAIRRAEKAATKNPLPNN